MSQPDTPLPENRGTEQTRFNALRHGVLSRYTVLPWEDEEDYGRLLEALVAEHRPSGVTEEHLVEEIAGVLWRKRRLRLAEAASHHHGLHKTLGPHRDTVKAALVHVDTPESPESPERVIDALRMSTGDVANERADLQADEAQTRDVLALLDAGGTNVYTKALTGLRDDTQSWWSDELARPPEELEEDEQPATPNIDGLRTFITEKVLPWFETRAKDIANRPLIRQQAFGEALDPDKLERLGRYEVHLDRKFERTLSMLLKLNDLRRPTIPG